MPAVQLPCANERVCCPRATQEPHKTTKQLEARGSEGTTSCGPCSSLIALGVGRGRCDVPCSGQRSWQTKRDERPSLTPQFGCVHATHAVSSHKCHLHTQENKQREWCSKPKPQPRFKCSANGKRPSQFKHLTPPATSPQASSVCCEGVTPVATSEQSQSQSLRLNCCSTQFCHFSTTSTAPSHAVSHAVLSGQHRRLALGRRTYTDT